MTTRSGSKTVVAISSAREGGRSEGPNAPPRARVTTPPAAAAVPSRKLSRVASSGWRARERAMTAREERLAGPMRREMKPETSDAADDAPGDLEQVETNRADGRRRPLRAREDRVTKVREQQQRETVQLQAEGVGAEAMTAEAIGSVQPHHAQTVRMRHPLAMTPRARDRGRSAMRERSPDQLTIASAISASRGNRRSIYATTGCRSNDAIRRARHPFAMIR